MYQLIVKDHFDSAHYIKDYPGKCSRVHGHRWNVDITLEGEKLDKMNILIDFSTVKKIMETFINKLDHYDINKQLKINNVTAEFLAKWIYEKFYSNLINDPIGWVKFKGINLVKVTVYESPDCGATYSE